MKIRVHGGNLTTRPVEIDQAHLIILYDDYEQPIMLAQRQGPGQIIVMRAGDSKFKAVLDAMGIGMNATVSEIKL